MLSIIIITTAVTGNNRANLGKLLRNLLFSDHFSRYDDADVIKTALILKTTYPRGSVRNTYTKMYIYIYVYLPNNARKLCIPFVGGLN